MNTITNTQAKPAKKLSLSKETIRLLTGQPLPGSEFRPSDNCTFLTKCCPTYWC